MCNGIEIVHTDTKNGYRLEVIRDFDPMNPRTEWDNLGVFSLKGGDVRWLNERPEIDHEEETAALIHVGYDPYDGSIFEVVGPWHRQHVGTGRITKAAAIEEWTGHTKSETLPEAYVEMRVLAISVLRAELEVYNQFLTGDVYGYSIEDPNGEHVDSLWGLYGLDYATSEANTALEMASQKQIEGAR
jgi:hypothetical protein